MIVLDVEIEKAIPPRANTPREPDIAYCEGWRDYPNMGIACVCTYELATGLSRVFLREELSQLAQYLRGRWTAGFNTRRFDNRLLAEHGVTLGDVQHYDMLEAIWRSIGLDPDRFVPATHGGWSLDAVCGATLGVQKSGDGASAPIWWQRGARGRVIDYCLRDVWLEAALLKFILLNGWVSRALPAKLAIDVPAEVLEGCGQVMLRCDVREMRGVYGSAPGC